LKAPAPTASRSARRLKLEGIEVFEVTRPKRTKARHRGKNDLQDAEAAAISALADADKLAAPKSRDGIVEAIRVPRIARASAVKSRTQTVLQMRNLILAAPEDLREALRDLTIKQLVARLAAHAGTVANQTERCPRRARSCASWPAAITASTRRSPSSTPTSCA